MTQEELANVIASLPLRPKKKPLILSSRSNSAIKTTLHKTRMIFLILKQNPLSGCGKTELICVMETPLWNLHPFKKPKER